MCHKVGCLHTREACQCIEQGFATSGCPETPPLFGARGGRRPPVADLGMGEATAAGAGMGEAAVGTRMGAAAAGTRGEEPAAAGRVFVVSNRLPVTAARLPSGQWEFKPSSGGLVTALAGVKAQVPFLWVGWLGQEIPPDEQEAVYSELRAKHAAIPVFLPDSIADGYYNRFSNGYGGQAGCS